MLFSNGRCCLSGIKQCCGLLPGCCRARCPRFACSFACLPKVPCLRAGSRGSVLFMDVALFSVSLALFSPSPVLAGILHCNAGDPSHSHGQGVKAGPEEDVCQPPAQGQEQQRTAQEQAVTRGARAVLPEGSGVELLACISDTDAGDSTQAWPSCVSVFTVTNVEASGSQPHSGCLVQGHEQERHTPDATLGGCCSTTKAPHVSPSVQSLAAPWLNAGAVAPSRHHTDSTAQPQKVAAETSRRTR